MYEKETSRLILNGIPDAKWRVKRGVRQGAVTSPLLFNLIPEQLTKRLNRHGTGLKIQGLPRINCLLYADDLVLLAATRHNLQLLWEQVEIWAQEYDLRINTSKTEYAIFNGKSSQSIIRLAGETITSTPSSTYLGLSKRNDKYKVHYEKRLGKAKASSFALSRIFKRLPHLAANTKLNITRACIKAVFLNGSEIGSK